MLNRLLLMSSAFHALNLAALLFQARLWRHRYAEEPAIRPRMGQILADLAALGLLAALSAVAMGAVGRAGGFGVINLMSRWIFGECLLLLLLSGYWLRRGGARRSGFAFATVARMCLLRVKS